MHGLPVMWRYMRCSGKGMFALCASSPISRYPVTATNHYAAVRDTADGRLAPVHIEVSGAFMQGPLQVISSMATREVLRELASQYQQSSGQAVATEAGGGVDVAKRVENGDP